MEIIKDRILKIAQGDSYELLIRIDHISALSFGSEGGDSMKYSIGLTVSGKTFYMYYTNTQEYEFEKDKKVVTDLFYKLSV